MRYFDDEAVSARLSTDDAIACVDRSFRLLALGEAVNAPRRRSRVNDAVLNVMWALAPTEGIMGVKAYPVVRANVTQGSVLTLLVYAIDSGELVAMLKADRLGQLRTGAATAVATRLLARRESSVLALFGVGFQAETQLRSVARVLPDLRTVHLVGRTPVNRDEFADRMSAELNLEIVPREPESAVRAADVIITATAADKPLFDGRWVRPGTHVNAVGSNAPEKRELDRSLLDRAARIAVDDREVAALDCGDLLVNGIDPLSVPALGEVLVGVAEGRKSPDEITVFESQGLALQDVICAGHVLRVARSDNGGVVFG